MRVTTKMIKILHNGPIYEKSGIFGPIRTPYMEDVQTIFRLLSGGKKVVEVLSNGKEVELNVSNFDKKNDIVENKPVQVVIPQEPVKPPVVEHQQNNNNNNFKNKWKSRQPEVKVEEEKKEVVPDVLES